MNSVPNPTDIQDTRAVRATLSMGNDLMNSALKTAMGAIYMLDAAGSIVLDIQVRGGRPVLTIDKPPRAIEGAWSVSRTVNGVQERVMVGRYHAAQLEWVERQVRPQ